MPLAVARHSPIKMNRRLTGHGFGRLLAFSKHLVAGLIQACGFWQGGAGFEILGGIDDVGFEKLEALQFVGHRIGCKFRDGTPQLWDGANPDPGKAVFDDTRRRLARR